MNRANCQSSLPSFAATIVVLFFVLIGCDKKTVEDSKAGSLKTLSAPFVTEADLKKGSSIDSSSANEVADWLLDREFIFANRPESKDDSACTETLGKIKVSAKMNQMTLGGEMDMTSCFQKDLDVDPENNLKASSPKIQVFHSIECDGIDFSSFSDREIGSIPDSEFSEVFKNKSCTGFKTVSQTKFESDLKTTVASDGRNIAYNAEYFSVEFEGKNDLSSCTGTVENGVLKLDNGCLSIDRNGIDKETYDGQETPGKQSYGKFTANDLTSAMGTDLAWHSSGTIDFEWNGCTGKLTYTDPNTAPAYEVSCLDGTEENGMLSLSLGLTKKKSAKGSKNPLFKKLFHR